ncbi:similar to Saccharomyces cerevisiae YJR100C AIM25 Putative protein of unknown function [Maudiozyma barnettii]|uniref:Phospholipid scramblase n=1 Tax=Maudiozyma barnettii TaxID=61262 RepID=A0A8H2VHQ1_9SACH|nr:Aim25p [Kazachstania barnettii]CAB4255630.1 similar to Saccharomyces cerevisiae YJR100C AIM25 Putative protein of unknown function [Kazachstania barnettii]CAD1784191.1 similar to Saccharomyces cerevisiae YJR100C AIM25 Putative protein of unknown function [Kazachstania barnettii]
MSSSAIRLSGVRSLLSNPILILERQIEFGNIIFGFEQNNRYRISNVNNETVGWAVERQRSFGQMMMRQLTKLHRPFVVDLFDQNDNYLFKIDRKFSFINSKLKVWSNDEYTNNEPTSEGILIGETVQSWHLWRRRYNLFVQEFKKRQHNENIDGGDSASHMLSQFGAIDAPFLSFEFPLMDEQNKILASVDRNWVGLGREFLTDTGVYVVRFDAKNSFKGVYDPSVLSDHVLNLDQRAILLANAISIDFDYFSRHSRGLGSGGFLPFGVYDE